MAQTTTPMTPGVPAPANSVWPSPPSGTVIPFPLPWGQTGCCPPGGMDALMKCYCDIQAATQFICTVMVDCINNNPAVVAAIIAQIEKSGTSVPLVGVTNGVAAQPGQVGEYLTMEQTQNLAVTTNTALTFNMGVLQPGDWDVWAEAEPTVLIDWINYYLTPPAPAGFSGDMSSSMGSGSGIEGVIVPSQAVQALISVPTLVVFTMNYASSIAGTVIFRFSARRRR